MLEARAARLAAAHGFLYLAGWLATQTSPAPFYLVIRATLPTQDKAPQMSTQVVVKARAPTTSTSLLRFAMHWMNDRLCILITIINPIYIILKVYTMYADNLSPDYNDTAQDMIEGHE